MEKGFQSSAEAQYLGVITEGEFHYGIFYARKGNGKKAVEHFQNAIQLYEEAGFEFMGFVLSFLGIGHYLLGDLKTARKYTEKGLIAQKKTKNMMGLSIAYLYFSMVCCDTGELEKAQDYGEKALELSQKYHENCHEGLSGICLGRILGKKSSSQFDKAEDYIRKGIKILEGLKLRPSMADGYLILGELYANTDRKEKAIEYLKKAESMNEEMERDYWLKKTQGTLAKL
jgi:tetratricopeptide (TPR) repeat protein